MTKNKLEPHEIEAIGFAEVGHHVHISPVARFYNPGRIKIGSHVRIDDFCVFSAGDGGIEMGSFIHIGAYSTLIGQAKITICDFAGISSRVSIYSSNDDYSGLTMGNPVIPEKYKNVYHAAVTLGRHVGVGSGSVFLPGVTAHEGAAVGALSLVTKDCQPFSIYFGAPARRIKSRKRDLLQLEAAFLAELALNEQRFQ